YGGTRGAWDAGTEWFEAADLTGVDLTVEAAASLAGVVLGPDEELVSDAWINAYLWTDEGWEYLTSTGTDEHGEFEFTELEAGAYTFYFSTYGTNAYSQYLGGGTQLPNSSD